MKVAKPIIHQQQPDAFSCVSTCLAMLIGELAEGVRDEYHEQYMEGSTSIPEYLAPKGLLAIPMCTTDWSEKEGGLFLIAAPSLNIERATHELIVDWRDIENGCVVIDPNEGKSGKRYYVCKHEEDLLENEYNLMGFFYDYRIEEVQ